MRVKTILRGFVGAAALATATLPTAGVTAPAGIQRPLGDLVLSEGRGQLVNLPAPMSDIFVSNDKVADVQVRSPTQLYVFAKTKGEATVFATTKGGQVVYSTNVRVGSNSNSLDQMLRLALPDAAIVSTPMNGLVLLTGTVAGPDDSAEAERLVQAFVGEGTQVVSRLKSATPLQVNLQVKIAEVSRALVKEIGVNLLTRDTTGGFQFNVAQGRAFGDTGIGYASTAALQKLDASSVFGLPAGSISLPFDPRTGQFVTRGATVADFSKLGIGAGKTSLGFLGRLFGVDVASALDLAENDGLVTTLAQPNLTALSGETASFLAGGEFPIPISQALGSITIQYKQYGVSLAFTPTVLADGRISMRVRPEVSELSSDGAIVLNGFNIPAITTRRAETTVELGSGQSFMIGGLMRNSNVNSVSKAPGLGDIPILGAMFRSSKFQRNETELMIVVTPYLVRPTDAANIKLPTDGYVAPNDAERVLLGQSFGGHTGEQRPKPTTAPPTTVNPVSPPISMFKPVAPAKGKGKQVASAFIAPGFSK
ncbi:Pilus formation protein N-terminal domain-containing protein [Sphingomonas antarctica]|uniref:type II and III secretion system protein family protein n=1 Tax=Sphingomonas antarctica TaxID=2040274 RepID=UPI0039EB3A09